MPADRLTGLLVAGFGLALLALIVPAQTETVDYGFVRPATLPNLLGALLVLLGLARALAPPRPSELAGGTAARAGLYLALTALMAWAMGRFGFLWVAPAMVLAPMLMLGERRPLWLAVGGGAIPGLVWVTVTLALDRTLPG